MIITLWFLCYSISLDLSSSCIYGKWYKLLLLLLLKYKYNYIFFLPIISLIPSTWLYGGMFDVHYLLIFLVFMLLLNFCKVALIVS